MSGWVWIIIIAVIVIIAIAYFTSRRSSAGGDARGVARGGQRTRGAGTARTGRGSSRAGGAATGAVSDREPAGHQDPKGSSQQEHLNRGDSAIGHGGERHTRHDDERRDNTPHDDPHGRGDIPPG